MLQRAREVVRRARSGTTASGRPAGRGGHRHRARSSRRRRRRRAGRDARPRPRRAAVLDGVVAAGPDSSLASKACTLTVGARARAAARRPRSASVPLPDAAFVTRASAHRARIMPIIRRAVPHADPPHPIEPGARRSLRARLRGGPVARAIARVDVRALPRSSAATAAPARARRRSGASRRSASTPRVWLVLGAAGVALDAPPRAALARARSAPSPRPTRSTPRSRASSGAAPGARGPARARSPRRPR